MESSDIKMVSHDILLTRTSQEMFGRKSVTPSTEKTKNRGNSSIGSDSKKDVASKKALLSKSLQGPLFHPSATKVSEHASNSGIKLANQLDRNNIEHNLRVGNDLQEVHSIKNSFEQKLQDISRYKAPVEETASQRNKRILLLTLQMPNYVRLLNKISRRRRRRIYTQVLHTWKTTTVALRALEKMIYGKELEAALRVQRAWNRRKIMKKHHHKKYLAMKAQQKKELLASQFITQTLRNFVQRRIAGRIVAKKRQMRREKMAIRIQKMHRGLVARAWRSEQLRLLLLQDLRDWAGGSVQKLIERPTQLDIYTEDLIRKAIFLVSNRPNYLRRSRPARLLRMFRKQIKLARKREEALNAQLKVEHRRMMHERVLMAENDREDWFKRNFNNVLAELARKALEAEELKEKREGEHAILRQARAEVFHIIERMKLDGLLERSEREKMFREEYTMRRIDNHFKQQKVRWHEANLFLMTQEDHRATDIRAEEMTKKITKDNLMEQKQKVKALLKLEEEKERERERERDGGGIFAKTPTTKSHLSVTTTLSHLSVSSTPFYCEHLQHVKLKDETMQEVSAMVEDTFQSKRVGEGEGEGENCPNHALCNCHHEWTSSLQLMKACAKRVDTTVREAIDLSTAVVTLGGKIRRLEHDEADGKYAVKKYLKIKRNVSKIPCRVDFHWKPDKNCSQKFRRVKTLQAYRQLRSQKLRVLSDSGEQFKQLHQSLLEVRRRLRVDKFASRKERRLVTDEAIQLEDKMSALETTILANCIEICENGRLEKMNFLNLFCVHIGLKDSGKDQNKTKQTKEKKLPGYMQKKKQVGPIIVASVNRHDKDRKKMEYSASTGQMVEVVDEGGDSEVDDDQHACPVACTISPLGDSQIQVPHAAPAMPPYILLHLHLKRTEAEQQKAAEQQKQYDRDEATASATASHDKKSVQGKKSFLKSAALNSPLSKYGGAQSESPPNTPPHSAHSRRKTKAAKRQSINVIHKPVALRGMGVGLGGGANGKGASKAPRKSMQNEHNDEDILRSKTLLEDVTDVELEKVILKEGSRQIPGLSKYPSEQTHLYLPLVRIEEIKKWSQGMSQWYEEVEQKWKQSKSALCLSFLQKARLLLTGGEKHKLLVRDDASLAAGLHSAKALDLVELLCCRGSLAVKPTASPDYVGVETLIPSRKLDMLCGKHPFSLQTYFSLLLSYQSYVKNAKIKTVPMWVYENSTVYTKNNLFARLGLLSLQPALAKNAFYCSKIIKLPVPWGYEGNTGPDSGCSPSRPGSPCIGPGSPTQRLNSPSNTFSGSSSNKKSHLKRMLQGQKSFSAATKKEVVVVEVAATLSHEDLCNSHAYVINLFAALISGLNTERKEESCLFHSLLSGENLNILSSFPKGEKDGTMMGKLRKKSNFGMKALWRMEFSPTYSVGGLMQSYREQYPGPSRDDWAMHLKSLESVPSWMFPVHYWGKPPPMKKKKKKKQKKRGKSISKQKRWEEGEDVVAEENENEDDEEEDDDEEDEEHDENIYEFEEKITTWAENLVKTLKRQANTRIKEKRMEIEAVTMNINKLHMGYEDKLASTIRLEDNRNYMMNETRKWKKKNGAWYKQLLNFMLRRQVEAIQPFSEEESLQEIETAIARLQWLRERLPSQKMPGGWTLCFTRLVGEPLYDLTESRHQYALRAEARAQEAARHRTRGHVVVAATGTGRGVRAPLTGSEAPARRHIRWTRMAGESYQKVLLARRMNSSLGEMVICGGIRKNVLIARVVWDEALQPEGSIMLEEMALPHCSHREIISYMHSARIGFQDRELCEGSYKAFAVTKTPTGRCLSESSLRTLRTELPGSEIENMQLRQKILWNILKENRYNTAMMIRQVIKLQSIFRRRLALKHTRRIKILRDRKSVLIKFN